VFERNLRSFIKICHATYYEGNKSSTSYSCLVLSNYAEGIEQIKVVLVPSDIDMNSVKLATGGNDSSAN
jgi:hypothetical protein